MGTAPIKSTGLNLFLLDDAIFIQKFGSFVQIECCQGSSLPCPFCSIFLFVEYADARSGVKRAKAFRKISSEYREIWRTGNGTDEELQSAMEQALQDGRILLPNVTILNYYVKFRAGNGGGYFVRGTTDSRSGARVEDEAAGLKEQCQPVQVA